MRVVKTERIREQATGRVRLVFRSALGRAETYPNATHFSDRELVLFHNISPDVYVWARHPNGLVTSVRYMEVDTTERGVYFLNRFPTLGEDDRDTVIRNKTLKELQKYVYADEAYKMLDGAADAITNKIFGIEEEKVERFAEGCRRRPGPEYRELVTILRDWNEFQGYTYVPQDNFNETNHVFVPEEGIMLSIGDDIAEYPDNKEEHILKSNISITIRNSNNPTRRYYANVFGKVISIPVTNTTLEPDGITITNTLNGMPVTEEFDLTQIEELGIYKNREDAEENANTEVRLKLAEHKAKEEGHVASKTNNETKLKIEEYNKEYARLKLEFEKERLGWEREKLELEAKRKEVEIALAKKESELEELRREHDRDSMKHEKELMELRLRSEIEKGFTTRQKALDDRRSNTIKTYGAVITTALAIVGAIWKFFF
jgi:hypothetical protein